MEIIRADLGRSFVGWCSSNFPRFKPFVSLLFFVWRMLRQGREWTSLKYQCTFRARRSDWLRFFSSSTTAWTKCLNSETSTWTSKKDKKDRVEKPECVVYHPLVDDSWNEEGDKLNNNSSFSEGREESIEIKVHVIVEPIVNNHIPFSVVWAEF